MSGDSFFARPYGMIQLHSLGVSFPRWTRETLHEPYRRHGQNGKLVYNQVRWPDVSPQDRAALLTDLHELDHFAVLISTPVGVLLWRLYQVITRDLHYLARTFREFGLTINRAECPNGIVEWFRRSGRNRLDLAAHTVPNGQLKIEYIEREVVRGLASVLRLLDILTCASPHEKHGDLTAGEFADLLNVTYDYLAQRCDVELHNDKWGGEWTTLQPHERLFPGPTALNVLLVMELLAYCRERRTVREMGATAGELKRWQSDRLPDNYEAAFNRLVVGRG